jgi:hypothetical protein
MTDSEITSPSPEFTSEFIASRSRVRTGLFLVLFGLLVFLVGIRPSLFGLDRSPVVGFVQIAVFLVGLAIVCIGGYIGVMAFWKNGDRTIPAEIGSRLVATGYVVTVFAGMADVFGFGSHSPPKVPYFGPWQAMGVQIGEVLVAIGFLLLIPWRSRKKAAEK